MPPWFIWKEIINYLVVEDQKYCFVNKAWFKHSAGQFIQLSSNDLTIGLKPCDCFKVAETISVAYFKHINWDYISECGNLISITIENSLDPEDFFNKIMSNICKTKLKTVRFEVSDKKSLERAAQFLTEISRQLRIMWIDIDKLMKNYDEILALDYNKLNKLTVRKAKGSIDLCIAHQFMPNLQHLIVSIDKPVLNPISANTVLFSNLKTLEIGSLVDHFAEFTKILDDIFNYNFPNLISCKLEPIICCESFKKIPSCMPELRILKITLRYFSFFDMKFPKHLEELAIYAEPTVEIYGRINLDLFKIPTLQRLTILSEFNLVNSNVNYNPLITYIHLDDDYNYPDEIIYDQLINLQHIKVNCHNLEEELGWITIMFEKVYHVTAYNLTAPFPDQYRRPGPYKTTKLHLFGQNFINNALIQWLTYQFDLTHLKLHYQSKLQAEIQPVTLPKLQTFDFLSQYPEDKEYLTYQIQGYSDFFS